MPINKIVARQGGEEKKNNPGISGCTAAGSKSEVQLLWCKGRTGRRVFTQRERNDCVLLRKEWTRDYNGRHVAQYWLERELKTTRRSPLTERTTSATWSPAGLTKKRGDGDVTLSSFTKTQAGSAFWQNERSFIWPLSTKKGPDILYERNYHNYISYTCVLSFLHRTKPSDSCTAGMILNHVVRISCSLVLHLGSQITFYWMETELTSRRLLRGTNCSLAQLFSGVGVGKGVGQWIYCRGRALWDCWCSGGGQTTPSKAQSKNLWLVYTEITCSWKFKANASTCRFGFFSALLSLPLPSVWSSPDTTSALAEFQSIFFLFVCLSFSRPVRRESVLRSLHLSSMHTDVEVSKTKTVRQKAQTGLKKKRGKNRKKEKESDKQEQTKTTKKPSKTVKT